MSEELFSRQISEVIQSDENRIKHVYLEGEQLRLSGNESYYVFYLSRVGVDAWKNLATTINNSQVNTATIGMPHNPRDTRPTPEYYEAFLGELKNNKTIKDLRLRLDHQIISTFLGYFLQNNSKMREPESKCEISFFGDFLTLEQITVLATVLRDARLWHLDLKGLSWFELEDGSFEQIVSACLGVNKLDVESSTNSHFTAVASLLRDPMSMLTYIKMDRCRYIPDDFDGTMALREIAESLAGNTRLKTIKLPDDISFYGSESVDEIDNLLCDSSTLEKIRSSNHTLEKIIYRDQVDQVSVEANISTRSRECLVLNRNTDKNKVIQNKVMQFYFVGHFDPAPFANMPLRVLPTVMSLGKEASNKQTALFELLRTIPDLCNRSSRSSSVDV
jgi:hypothetical protein